MLSKDEEEEKPENTPPPTTDRWETLNDTISNNINKKGKND